MKTSSKLLFIDIETYSEADLKKCGVYRYAEDPSFEIMLFAYAYNDEPVQVIDLASGEEIPGGVLDDLTDPAVLKIAHNANFERTCLTEWLNTYMPPEQWYCTAVRASTLGLPRSLAGVGEAIGLPEDEKKMAIGKRLIQYFAKPCPPTKTNGGRKRNLPYHEPEKWALYKEYNAQDVVTERAIFQIMARYPEIPDAEHELWCVDQRINEHGALIDGELVDNILDYSERRAQQLENRAKEISGVDNPSSFPQIRKWLKTKGIEPESLDKDAVKELLKQCDDREVIEFLQIRQELGKTSVAKYTAMDQAKCADGRVRGMFQHYGAATGRWTSRIVQLQNLPQNKMADLDLARGIVKRGDFELLELLYNSPMDVFSQLIRTAFIAGAGKTYAVADYSAIEARVVAWLADEDWVLQAFRDGKDIYCETASQMFKCPVVKNGINGELRKKGKVATLACGYQGAVGAMRKMGGEQMGLTDAEMKSIVEAWRASNPNITALWKTAENTMKKAIAHPGVVFRINHGITFQMQSKVLFVTLPSGRSIAYQGARIERAGDKTSLKYMRQEQTTQKWVEVDTYGGSIVENCLSGDTIVLTNRGLIPMRDIQKTDRLWDGEEWVTHNGLKSKGIQQTIEVDGVRMTPEHKILTEGGWRNASQSEGHYRAKVRIPDSYILCGLKRAQIVMEGKMRLRQRKNNTRYRIDERAYKKLRVYDAKIYIRVEQNTWRIKDQAVGGMALDEREVYVSNGTSVEELRRTRNQSMRPLAEQLRSLQGRHGSYVCGGTRIRQDRQQWQLLPGKLQMGITQSKPAEQTESTFYQYSMGQNNSSGSIRTVGNRRNNTFISAKPRSERRRIICNPGRYEQVYDLMNAGPQHRFTVLTNNGLMLVHNCTQAVARDCLGTAIVRLHKAGYTPSMHIHDEVVIEVDKKTAESDLQRIREIMSLEDVEWKAGLPLKAEGYLSPYYKKD